jgi:hypothetical protein
MRVTARGWSRDHGEKELLNCEVAYADIDEEVGRYSRGKTYFEVIRWVQQLYRNRRKVNYTVRISAHAELNLSGSYLVQLELSRAEIARLFYETNGDQGLPELLKLFSEFRGQGSLGTAKQETA